MIKDSSIFSLKLFFFIKTFLYKVIKNIYSFVSFFPIIIILKVVTNKLLGILNLIKA